MVRTVSRGVGELIHNSQRKISWIVSKANILVITLPAPFPLLSSISPNGHIYRVFSIISGTFLPRSNVVEGFKSFGSVLLLGIAEHVQGDTVVDILLRANPINCLLHFAVAAVAALHGIGG